MQEVASSILASPLLFLSLMPRRKKLVRTGTRTQNLLLRRQAPYPLGHGGKRVIRTYNNNNYSRGIASLALLHTKDASTPLGLAALFGGGCCVCGERPRGAPPRGTCGCTSQERSVPLLVLRIVASSLPLPLTVHSYAFSAQTRKRQTPPMSWSSGKP